jgi:hypothetical protein
LKITINCIGRSIKFLLKVGVEGSIVNAPHVSLQSKHINKTTSEVRFKHLIRGGFTIDSSTPTLRRNLNEHPILIRVHFYPTYVSSQFKKILHGVHSYVIHPKKYTGLALFKELHKSVDDLSN